MNDIQKNEELLFKKVITILEKAKNSVVQSVNTNMVFAYWLIGREIVLEIQAGDKRADYGKEILINLSDKLITKYGAGYSVPNLQNFRKFFLAFPERFEIQYPLGTKSENQIKTDIEKQYPAGTKSQHNQKSHPMGDEFSQRCSA